MTLNDWKKDYPSYQELSEDELDENHSLKKMFRLIGENKRVLDFGCATGYLAQLLSKKGCTVTGVEINPDAAKAAEKYCEQVIVADLDFVAITEVLAGQKFDIAVFGDILEHLRNPWKVLEETQHLLKPDGYVVASIPNIAHGAIRLSLLQGKFEYKELGILDYTHLRFFTRKTVVDLFERSGYLIGNIDCTKVPVFSDIPLLPDIDKNDFSVEVIQTIEQDADVDTFQFIIRAFPLSLEGKYAALNEQSSQLKNQIERSQSQLQHTQAEQEYLQSQLQNQRAEQEHSQSQLQHTQAELEQSKLQLQHTQLELERSQSQLQHTQSELERSQSQLQNTQSELERSQSQLQNTQSELERSQSQLQNTQSELEQLKATITWIQTSKFWKLRTQWLKLKKLSRMVKES